MLENEILKNAIGSNYITYLLKRIRKKYTYLNRATFLIYYILYFFIRIMFTRSKTAKSLYTMLLTTISYDFLNYDHYTRWAPRSHKGWWTEHNLFWKLFYGHFQADHFKHRTLTTSLWLLPFLLRGDGFQKNSQHKLWC